MTTPQVFLDHRPREEVQRLVAAKTNGATPLVLSCRSHHLSSPDTQGNLSHLTISLHLTPGQPVSLGFLFRNGHHEVVEYLVDRCCASVEQVPSSWTRYCQRLDYPKYYRLSKILSIIQDIVDYSRYHLRRAVSPLTGKRSRELLHCGALLQQVTSIFEEQ